MSARFFVAFLLLFALSVASVSADEFDDLRERWVAMQTGGAGIDLKDLVLAGKAKSVGTLADGYWKTLQKPGEQASLWSDLPIGGKPAKLFEHFERLEAMALAYRTPGSGLQGNKKLAQDVVDGLDWLCREYYNPEKKRFGNWWEWEIGMPLSLGNTVSYLYAELGAERVAKYMAAVDFFQPSVHMSGANRLWESEVIILRGLLGKDGAKVASGIEGLADVLAFNRKGWGDGFYDDGSFIQHGRIPYNGGYGKSLFRDIVDLQYLLSGSSWELKSQDAKNVHDWASKAYEPFLIKGEMMDMVRGREIAQPSRNAHKIGHQTMHPFVRLSQFAPPEEAGRCKSLLKAWIQGDTLRDFYEDVPLGIAAEARKIVKDPAVLPAAEQATHRQFPMMARVVHRRPGFGFGLSMNSSRVGSYEAINSTNGKGWYTADGMTYLYNQDLGQFSEEFWPTVDFYRLPGTTVDTKERKNAEGNNALSKQTWVGGADLDGKFGVAGMQLQGFGVSLSAKKSWFLFDDAIVALGADIQSTDGRTIETIVENRKIGAKGDNALVINGKPQPSTPGWKQLSEGARWAHLKGNVAGADIGYYFPEPCRLNGLREARTGKWSDICSTSGDRDDTVRTGNYVTLWFDHRANPTGATYVYVLLPNKTAAEVAAYAGRPAVEILENSPKAQAVRDKTTGITGANFWTDQEHAVGGITSKTKASVMLREDEKEIVISASDPTQANDGKIELEVARGAKSTIETSPGVSVQQLEPTIRLSIAVKKAQGKTFLARFSKEDPASAKAPTASAP